MEDDINIYELQIKPEEMCRACLCQKNNLQTIFYSDIVDNEIISFPKMFETTIEIKITKNDGLPDKICSICKTKIIELYSFKQKCKKSNELLYTIFGNEKSTNIPPIVLEGSSIIDRVCSNEKMKAERLSIDIEEEEKEAIFQINNSVEYLDSNLSDDVADYVDYEEEADTMVMEVYKKSSKDSENLYCAMCPKNFTKSSDLRRHMNCIHDRVKYECIVCDKKYSKVITRNKHLKEMHPTEYQNLYKNHPDLMSATEMENMETEENQSIIETTITERTPEYDDDNNYEERIDYEDGNDDDDERHEDPPFLGDEGEEDEENKIVIKEETILDNSFFNCNICNIEFNNESLFLTHNMSEHNSMEYVCIVCNSEFNSIEELTEHNIKHNLKKRRKRSTTNHFICPFCNIKVKENNIKLHMEFHKKTFRLLIDTINYFFHCGKCSTIFESSDQLENHLNNSKILCDDNCDNIEITENEFIGFDNKNYEKKIISCYKNINNMNYKCTFCNDFENESIEIVIQHNLDLHLSYNDNTDLPELDRDLIKNTNIYKCGLCGILLANSKEALLHIYFHMKLFPCPFYSCGNEYDSFCKLNMHLEKVHINYKSPICNHCDAQFENNDDLALHLKNECKRNLKCFFCEKKFLTQGSLRIHERIHTNERRFMCQFCGKKFVQRGDLTTHNRMHTGEKPYKCFKCDKRFRTLGNRKDHLSTHNENKNFECVICNQKFKAQRILKSHMLLHTEKKQYECNICYKLFARKQHVKAHLKIHDKKKKV